MAKNVESSIQGLNIIPTDPLSDELSPMSDDINRDLDVQLAMWTNFQFPTSSSNYHKPGDDDDEGDPRIFSPERDTASRSRHKAVPLEDFASSAFFGNVGASLLAAHAHAHHPAPVGHAAAHERAKLQQLQQHLQHSQSNTAQDNTNHHRHQAAINDLFSYLPYNADDLGPAIVDPFLNPNDFGANANAVGGGLSPLTIRNPPVRVQQQMQTIDPANTTLVHRPVIPLQTTKRAGRTKSTVVGAAGLARPNIIIPVDQSLDYALHPRAQSTIGDDGERDHDHDHEMHDGADHDDAQPPQQMDANGQPIPYSAAEDKRRRNTLASARFRQKKKEREVAMEKKARDLDDRVAGLERECESLRKENRMLRGLLVDGVPVGSAVPDSLDAADGKAAGTSVGVGGVGAGASVVLLEELVRLLKANSAALQPAGAGAAQTTLATAAAASAPRTSTGKRKRGGGN